MTTIEEENYRKGVEKAIERWQAKITTIGSKAKKPREELKKLRAIGAPTADDKKKIAAFEAELDKLAKDVEASGTELKLDVLLLGPLNVPKKTPKSELDKLPKWMKELIKAKGVPLGNGVVITPEVEFDWTTFKPKYIGVKVKW